MKAIAPKINDTAAEFYPLFFKTLNAGVRYTTEAFPTLYKRTLSNLAGVFSEDELFLVIDVFNATMLTPMLAGVHLAGNVQDGIKLDGLDKKWNVNKDVFLTKIKNLHLFDAACIEIWANGFWYGGLDEKKTGWCGSFKKSDEKSVWSG